MVTFMAWCSHCETWKDGIGATEAVGWLLRHRRGHIIACNAYRRLVAAVHTEAETALT